MSKFDPIMNNSQCRNMRNERVLVIGALSMAIDYMKLIEPHVSAYKNYSDCIKDQQTHKEQCEALTKIKNYLLAEIEEL